MKKKLSIQEKLFWGVLGCTMTLMSGCGSSKSAEKPAEPAVVAPAAPAAPATAPSVFGVWVSERRELDLGSKTMVLIITKPKQVSMEVKCENEDEDYDMQVRITEIPVTISDNSVKFEKDAYADRENPSWMRHRLWEDNKPNTPFCMAETQNFTYRLDGNDRLLVTFESMEQAVPFRRTSN